jgi:hypothetical protein
MSPNTGSNQEIVTLSDVHHVCVRRKVFLSNVSNITSLYLRIPHPTESRKSEKANPTAFLPDEISDVLLGCAEARSEFRLQSFFSGRGDDKWRLQPRHQFSAKEQGRTLLDSKLSADNDAATRKDGASHGACIRHSPSGT